MTKELTIKNLVTLFGVTSMTIYSWKKGTASKAALPTKLTPAAVKKWAERNAAPMSCDPVTLLGTGIGKPGPKPRVITLPTRAKVSVKRQRAEAASRAFSTRG